jgi:DNA-binding NarL/FixJ family response regulator
MAGKPKRMGQIKQLLRLHGQGHGKKAIARELGISKNTVKAYL